MSIGFPIVALAAIGMLCAVIGVRRLPELDAAPMILLGICCIGGALALTPFPS